VITGGAGQIAYSLLPPLASGAVFGMDQPVILHLLDIPPAITALGGVVMELEDLAYPLLAGVLGTTDPDEAFKDVDYAIFLGAFPRKEGMERKDVMTKNIGIFNSQGSALSKGAKPGVKCVVVGNPANTNAAILARAAPNVDPKNISALTRLDHNRASSHLAIRCGVSCDKVSGVIIWGNHSSTQYPDVRHATVDGKPAREVCTDAAWIEGEYITKVQKRGAAIIEARKLSSAASAAKAICDHMRDWVIGTGDGYVSMAVKSDGSHYGVPEGLFYSMPVKCSGGEWTVVDGLPIDEFSQGKMTATANELSEELALALSLL
jgi:malate dehydrogenase